MKNDELLSIGEFAKYSDRSIKSIKYYEQLGFLIPAFIDPETNYRYYHPEQVALLEVAQFCTELDIPLKDVPDFLDNGMRLKASALLQSARRIAEGKLIKIQRTLNAIAFHEDQLENVKAYAKNPMPYEAEMGERYFFTTPYVPTTSISEFRKAMLYTFNKLHQLGVTNEEIFDMENGIYFEYDGLEAKRYYFVEVPCLYPNLKGMVKTVPAGIYECRQSNKTMINNTSLLTGTSPFIAIETEMFSDPYDLNQPLWELKVLKNLKNR